MRRLGVLCALAAAAACLWTTTAFAVPVSSTLTSDNGFGSFDDTIGCPSGDGQSWRYLYSGTATAGTGPVGGVWFGTIEVHRGTSGGGFVPFQTGRLGIEVPDRGRVNLEFDGGDCATTPLSLGPGDEPTVSGTLPFHVTGGSGAFRSLTGTGTIALAAQLTKGADNAASLAINGDLAALQPNITVGNPTAKWARVVDYLGRRIGVSVPILNDGVPATTGDAFDVRIVSVSVSDGASAAPPGPIPRVNAGAGSGWGFNVNNVSPGKTYSITMTIAAKDALGGAATPVTVTRSFKAPLTPLNII